MPTIRIREWTKEQLEHIQQTESHSSHDSVIKSLLKDHELAQFAGATGTRTETSPPPLPPATGAFDELTVFDELTDVEDGVLFLWCPNCSNEMAHLSVDPPLTIPVYEMKCQHCLTHLDQHAIVGIEIGYPIEKRLVEETLHDDLKTCVIDYWDRKLEHMATETADDTEIDHLVWQFSTYIDEFGWDWPADIPVVSIDIGETYRDEMTGDSLEVLECVTENRNQIDSYRIRRHSNGTTETEVLGAGSLTPLLLRRSLYIEDPADDCRD